MARSDDTYDLLKTFDQGKSGKSKTDNPAVRELGRDGAGVEKFIGTEVDESAVRDPPSGVRYVFFNQSGDLRVKSPSGGSTTLDVDAIDVTSVTTDDSVTVQTGEATDTLHYGSNQDRSNAGDTSVAIGIDARAPGDDGSGGSINNQVAVGYSALKNNTGDRVTGVGGFGAWKNTGDRVTGVGYTAAGSNTGFETVAVGQASAQNNTANIVSAVGFESAQENTGKNVVAVGGKSAERNDGRDVIAIGIRSAQLNTGDAVIAVGLDAARGDGLTNSTTMGGDNIGIGKSAIRNNQASGLIAIGQQAGINAQTDDPLIVTDRNGDRRMEMDLTNGDLSIEGSLTQNASL